MKLHLRVVCGHLLQLVHGAEEGPDHHVQAGLGQCAPNGLDDAAGAAVRIGAAQRDQHARDGRADLVRWQVAKDRSQQGVRRAEELE